MKVSRAVSDHAEDGASQTVVGVRMVGGEG